MELKLSKLKKGKDQNHAQERIQMQKIAQKRVKKAAVVGPNGQKDENFTLSKSNQTCLTDIKL